MKINDETVRGVWLSTPVLKSRVFEHLYDDSDLLFLSNTTQNLIEIYQEDSGQDKNIAKKLWKELLIDSICILKMNDSREKLYEDTKNILDSNTEGTLEGETERKDESAKKLFLEKFCAIRRMSTYGIDELSQYFDDFVEFESVLYGTGEFYRDHIHHVLQVWAVGIGLIAGLKPINLTLPENFIYSKYDFHFETTEAKQLSELKNKYNELKKKGSDTSEILKELKNAESNASKIISKSEIWAMWTIISLCHDLGYPLEKASNINRKVKKIVNHFGCLSFNELNFNFDLLNSFIVDKFLKVVASKTVREGYGCEKNKGMHRTEVQQKYLDKISKSLEEYRHGMFSGLLVFKKLTYFLETDYSPENNSLSSEDLRQFYIRKEILRAICGHTCSKIYHIDISTISFLLILCDEIQEWGRPRFDEYVTGNLQDKQEVRVDKYESSEKISKIHIGFRYKEKLSIETEKTIALSKFENMHCLLRSAKDDYDRKIEFQWSIQFKDSYVYTYKFNSQNSSYEMVKCYYNFPKKEKDKKNLYLFDPLSEQEKKS